MSPSCNQITCGTSASGGRSTTETVQHCYLQSTVTQRKSSVATLSAGSYSTMLPKYGVVEQECSSLNVCCSAHPSVSENQLHIAPRASYTAPIPWSFTKCKHAVCDLGVQLSCSFEEENDVHLGLARCCDAAFPDSAVPNSNIPNGSVDGISLDAGLQYHLQQDKQLQCSNITASDNGQRLLRPIAEDRSLHGSGQIFSGTYLSQQQSSCTVYYDNTGHLAVNSPYTSLNQHQQQGPLLQQLVPSAIAPLAQIEEEIVQLLLMKQQLSAAASAATAGTPIAAACAAALRRHDATLMHALKIRDALEQTAIEAEADDVLWHHSADVLGLNGASSAAAAVHYSPAQQHNHAWLAIGRGPEEHTLRLQNKQWQKRWQKQDKASYRQQQGQHHHHHNNNSNKNNNDNIQKQQQRQWQHACLSAPVNMRAAAAAAHSDSNSGCTMHHAAALNHEAPEQLLMLLPMI